MMTKLPHSFSIHSIRLRGAISEARPEDVIHELIDILRRGEADRATQIVAADWIEAIGLKKGDAKALRGGRDAIKKEWIAVSEMVTSLQREGKTYSNAVLETAAHYGYKERHVQTCVAMLNRILNEEAAQK